MQLLITSEGLTQMESEKASTHFIRSAERGNLCRTVASGFGKKRDFDYSPLAQRDTL